MLVLSRTAGEKIVFPAIGVTIELLQIKGKKTRLGIDAPADLTVLRDELVGGAAPPEATSKQPPHARPVRLPADLRDRLRHCAAALKRYQKQVEGGLDRQAESALAVLIAEFAAVERAAQRSVLEAGNAAPHDDPDARRRLTLVVEDDATQRELLAGVLRMNGFDVDTAGDGAAALDYLATHEPPDLVLLDMFMPRCDGRETVQAIRHNPALEDLRVYAISGSPPTSLGVSMGPHGVDGWFRKPVNPERLIERVDQELTAGC